MLSVCIAQAKKHHHGSRHENRRQENDDGGGEVNEGYCSKSDRQQFVNGWANTTMDIQYSKTVKVSLVSFKCILKDTEYWATKKLYFNQLNNSIHLQIESSKEPTGDKLRSSTLRQREHRRRRNAETPAEKRKKRKDKKQKKKARKPKQHKAQKSEASATTPANQKASK